MTKSIRGAAVPVRPSRPQHLLLGALAALMILCALATATPARAETGELAHFGSSVYPPDLSPAVGSAYESYGSGPIAMDPTDGNDLYIAASNSLEPSNIQKVSPAGSVIASAAPVVANPGGATPFAAALALDPSRHRLYVLWDADDHGRGQARQITVYSTTPQSGALVAPADIPSGVLVDFREAGSVAGAVDYATGLAVDPVTGDVVVLGVADSSAADPQGVLQYVSPTGALVSRVEGFGAGIDPNGTTISKPAGLAIAPDGDVYVAASEPDGNAATQDPGVVYRLTAGTSTWTHFVSDTNGALMNPGFEEYFGAEWSQGSSIALSQDGSTLYLAEGTGAHGRIRGYSTATAEPTIVYGRLDGDVDDPCVINNPSYVVGLAAGDGNSLAVTSFNITLVPGDTVNVFGGGGSGCPRTKGSFTVAGKAEPTVAVTKGQSVALDASASELLGGNATAVEWDWSYDEATGFTADDTVLPVAPATSASLTTSHKFTTIGSAKVAVRIKSDGAPPTEPVAKTVNVSAVVPTAAFKASTTTPAAGGTVEFNASASQDSSETPPTSLKTYRWNFGDGQTLDATGAVTSHAFANPGSTPLSRTVTLIVVSHDGVESRPLALTITVAPGSSPGQPPAGNPPASNPPITIKPTPRPLVCKKGFAKKKGRCVKAPPKKKHHKKHKKPVKSKSKHGS